MAISGMSEPAGRTFFEKVWSEHVIADLGAGACLLQVDRLLLHDVTGGVVMRELGVAGHAPDSPRQVFAIIDHLLTTLPAPGRRTGWTPVAAQMIDETRHAAGALGLRLLDVGDPRQGITHVVAPELGIALPGLTVVCGDSHTCTLGGIGALGWGIGTSEGTHALATQTLVEARPKTMRVNFDGVLPDGVTAKDMALALIGRIGAAAGSGYAVEFAGSAVRALPIEARLTLCNMAVEFSAKYGVVAPDEATFAYLKGREFAPRGAAWEAAVAHWRTLASDPQARFDAEIRIDASSLQPQVTWGTSPQHASAVSASVPWPTDLADPADRALAQRALDYQKLGAGTRLEEVAIDVAYIGTCTNARLSDLRLAADFLRGKKVAPGVTAICVPGSNSVKLAAEAEGLDDVFRAAGFEWHEAGCGMCGSGRGRFEDIRVISTSNRNFENRQGKRTRTHLASPLTVAASAVAGHIADARRTIK
jgi:3-isopropylmalate/(R)-2-methylmalate dehydratase large subunit